MDAIVSIDERQRVVLFNPAAEKMFGVEAGEALGVPLSPFIPERRVWSRSWGREAGFGWS
jgi:PAS domain S-box-containing protein